MKKYRLIYLGFLIGLGCQSAPKNFVDEKGSYLHKPTGIQIPKQIKNWSTADDGVNENLSPEIMASVSFARTETKNDLASTAMVFIMRSKSPANLKLIENRGILTLQEPQSPKVETIRLPSKKKISVTSYLHQYDVSSLSGAGVSLHKKIRAESLFVQSPKNPQLVMWITFKSQNKEEKERALQLIDDLMLK